MPAPERNDEQVHVLEVEEAAPSRLPLILGLTVLLVVGGAGAYVWLNPSVLEGLGGKQAALAPPPAAGNLLGDAWSFETTETSSASQAWVVPPEAPSGFDFKAQGVVSGELAAVARPGDPAQGAGWSRMLAEHALPLGAHRGAVELSGMSTGENIQLLLRFEAPNRAPIDIVVASGRGRISGQAAVPPGSTTVRAGFGCVGEGALDDLDLRFVESSGPAALDKRGTFDVAWLNPGLLVFRGDELVFQIQGLAAKDATGGSPPPSSQWMPAQQSLVLPGGAVIARTAERGGDERRITARESLTGIPAGTTLTRTALVHGSLAELPLGVISSRGYEQFTGDFKVEGVLSVVLGRTQDRLALELGEAATLAGTWQADGSIVLRSELPATGSLSHELALQTSFQEERVAAAQHRDTALAAEKAGRLGEALTEVAIVATKYPHDEAVNADAAALRSRVQAVLQARVDKIDRELEDALFLASAARCREVLADAQAAAQTFAGSEAEARFQERAATVEARAAQLLAEDEQRRVDRLKAVLASFETSGGYPSVVAELKEYLDRVSPRVIGLDIGENTTRVVEARLRKGAFEIRKAAAFPTDELATSLRERGLKGCRAIVGVTGRDMILRTTQVPSVPTWQLRELMAYEIEEVSEQSGDELSADFNLLTGARRYGDDEMALLALVRDSLIDERTGQLAGAGVSIAAFTPNAIALHNAVVATDGGEGVVLVASLGGRTTDVAILQDGELLFARNLGGGGELFTEALAEALRLDEQAAEVTKRKLAAFLPPGQAPASAQQAAVVRALDGPLRQVAGMLQSSLVLCRNQLKAPELKLTRVLLCGAGAAVPGLDQALTRTLGVPVARFDPTDGYLTEGAEIAEGRGGDFAIAAGLALMAVLKDSYRVEILSERVASKRKFMARTLWLWLAGALVVGHLVLATIVAKADYDQASEDRARASREVEARKADLRAYERAGEEVQEVSARLMALEDLTAPGSGAITVLDRLDGHLPSELWLRGLRTQRAIEAEFEHGGERRPFVSVEGEGKEQSRGLTDAVTELTTRLRADPGISKVVPRFTTNNKGKFSFSLSIDTSLFPQQAVAGSANETTNEDATKSAKESTKESTGAKTSDEHASDAGGDAGDGASNDAPQDGR